MATATDVQSSESRSSLAPFLLVPEPRPRHGLARLGLSWQLSSHILRVALPVVLGMVTQTAINILDHWMVGRLPAEEANPGQSAISLSLPFMWLVGGFLSAVWVGTQAITSRRAGEGNDLLAGRALMNSLAIALLSSVIFSVAAILAAPTVIARLYSDPIVVANATDYLQIRFVGVAAMVGTFSVKSFFDGIGKTHVFMTAAVIMNLMNVLLNYFFIFGFEPLGIPKMGVVGAALASVTAAYLGFFILIGWSFSPTYLDRYRFYAARNLNLRVIREIVRLSLPNGAATVVVMLGFSAFYWVVGQVNELYASEGNPIIQAAASNVIVPAQITLMTSLAFGSATAAVVSQSMGAKRMVLAERYAWEAAKLWAYFTWGLGAVMFFAPDQVIGIFNPDPAVIEAARLPLRMVAAPHGIITIAIILAQTLYGVGNAKFVMIVELCLHLFVMAPGAYLFGLVLDLQLPGVFLGPLVYAMLLATIMVIKFARGDWKEIEI